MRHCIDTRVYGTHHIKNTKVYAVPPEKFPLTTTKGLRPHKAHVSVSSKNILATLSRLGYRITKPRRLLAQTIVAQKGAFSAEQLNRDVPGAGRATAYRMLNVLEDAGFLCRTEGLEGFPRYLVENPLGIHHHHAVCVECGSVEEILDDDVERALASLAQSAGGELRGHRLDIYVKCSDCLNS